jgi:hypothetical protein
MHTTYFAPYKIDVRLEIDIGASCLAAAPTGAAYLLTGLQLGATRLGLRGGLHPGLNLAGHGKERLLDVGCVLGRGLDEFNAEGVRELFALVVGNNTLRSQVGLVSHEQLVNVLVRIAMDSKN